MEVWSDGGISPIKHQLIRYEEFDSSDLTDDKYLEIDVEDTYEVEENVTSYTRKNVLRLGLHGIAPGL